MTGILADDNTGASDSAGMLTEAGIRTVLIFSISDRSRALACAREYDAVVIGTGIRSMTPECACRTSREAAAFLLEAGARKIQIKYCSTFDSTPEGNIGQSLDAVYDLLKERGLLQPEGVIVCPALPVNGRTTCYGYHFVHGRLLSESSMKDHPLNPMTDSDLVRWLSFQTKRNVVSVNESVVQQGPSVLKKELLRLIGAGARYLVTDALNDTDLSVIAQAAGDWSLTSGGSGITAAAARMARPDAQPLSFSGRLSGISLRTLAVSGSCSVATGAQNRYALKNGFQGISVDPKKILDGRMDAGELARKARLALKHHDVLLFTGDESQDPVDGNTLVRDVHEFGRALGLSPLAAGEKIGEVLAGITAEIVKDGSADRLIVSGGETSGTICRRLGFSALEVGLPVSPGVPYCFPVETGRPLVVLKSGNFGTEDFYLKVKTAGG